MNMSSLMLNQAGLKDYFSPERSNRRLSYEKEVIVSKGANFVLKGSKGSSKSISAGQMKNISNGGLCLVSKTKVNVNDFLRLSFKLEALPVAIPTLVEVRWVQKTTDSFFKFGVRFVF
jgi:hypothetical protein